MADTEHTLSQVQNCVHGVTCRVSAPSSGALREMRAAKESSAREMPSRTPGHRPTTFITGRRSACSLESRMMRWLRVIAVLSTAPVQSPWGNLKGCFGAAHQSRPSYRPSPRMATAPWTCHLRFFICDSPSASQTSAVLSAPFCNMLCLVRSEGLRVPTFW